MVVAISSAELDSREGWGGESVLSLLLPKSRQTINDFVEDLATWLVLQD